MSSEEDEDYTSEFSSDSDDEDPEEEDVMDSLSRLIHTASENNDLNTLYHALIRGVGFLEDLNSFCSDADADSDGDPSLSPLPDDWSSLPKIVISRDVSLDTPDELADDYTPLHRATDQGLLEVARLLLLSGCDPNARTANGETCLHLAIVSETENQVPLFHLLLQHGARYDLTDNRGRSVVELSVIKNAETCTRLMNEYGADVSFSYDRDLLRQVERVANIEDVDTNEYDLFRFGRDIGSSSSNPSQSHSQSQSQSPVKKIKTEEMNVRPRRMSRRQKKEAALIEQFGVGLRTSKSRALHLKKRRRRVRKWRNMLRRLDGDGMCRHRKIKERIRKGIPNSMRGRAWVSLVPIEKYKRDHVGLYWSLVKRYSPHTRQIDLDINRTFREHLYFRRRYSPKQIACFNILKAYSNYDLKVGYCQGMNSIVALLLMYVEDEEDVFWFLVHLMNDPKYQMAEIFLDGFPGLHESFYVHERLLAKKLPKLCAHFTEHNLFTSMYATKIYMLFMMETVNFDGAVRIWEVFLSEGRKVIFSFAITLLRLLERDLLSKRFEQIIPFLQELTSYDLDVEKFVTLAVKRKVKHREIIRECREYRMEKAREAAEIEARRARRLQAAAQKRSNSVRPVSTDASAAAESSSYLHRRQTVT